MDVDSVVVLDLDSIITAVDAIDVVEDVEDVEDVEEDVVVNKEKLTNHN